MVSPETLHTPSKPPVVEPPSSPARISFSAEFLDENNFISICPVDREKDNNKPTRTADFEFLSGNISTNMLTADELFSEGKLLPFWQAEKLNKIASITTEKAEQESHDDQTPHDQNSNNNNNGDDRRISWFLDDDPSPRPPKCTVLWKELLRLKKQRPVSTLSPSSSSSSSSSGGSLGDQTTSSTDEKKKGVGNNNKEKVVNRVKKGLERTRSASIRIRPMVNVPICAHGKNNNSLPPLFSMRRSGRLD